MKTSTKLKKITETKSEFSCEFCLRSFQKEQTMMNHLCESKRRWQDRDFPGNRIGFQSWIEFYKKNTTSKKPKTYVDFTKSAYYLAFVKFGHYCVGVRCISVPRYAEWLLKNSIKIDSWTSDVNYTKFIIEYLKAEDPMDAIARSIETAIELAKDAGIESKDTLRYGNRNKICHVITTGRISPWMLYHSESGIKLLEDLDESQQKMILDYINPEQWAIKFKRNSSLIPQVKALLQEGGF